MNSKCKQCIDRYFYKINLQISKETCDILNFDFQEEQREEAGFFSPSTKKATYFERDSNI